MMSASNPYAFESVSPFIGPAQGSPTEALNRSIQALVETPPWVRIMGVFASICTFIIIVVLVVMYAISMIMNGVVWLFAEPKTTWPAS